MPTDVDRELARADALLHRTRERYGAVRRRVRRAEVAVLTRLVRIAVADGAILFAAIVAGLLLPTGIGTAGAILVMALLIIATLVFAIFPLAPEATAERIAQAPIASLPVATERWLEAQRAALPAPARTLVDSIGVRLETLAPQLAGLDENSPAAVEVRKLVGEQLPQLVKGYGRVPEPLRRTPRNGLTPDQQLVQGLQVIEEEIGEMTHQLAQGDLDLLATRERYLQIRYRDDEITG